MKGNFITRILIVTIFISVSITLIAQQGCPTSEQYYTNQNQVDSFLIKYPTCTTLLTKVTVSGPGIMNLNGFKNLKNIYIGGFHIENCPSLQSFSGLDSVKILAALNITGAIHMDTLFAWPALDFINLRIKDNNSIKSLKGLYSVRQNREIFLENTVVKNLNGLAGDSILYDLNLISNPELEDVDAMVNKKTIARIFIENNQKLKQIDGMGYVNNVLDLHIKNNYSLIYLPDFNDIKTINNIMIRDEPAKTNITNIPRFKGLKSAKEVIIFGLHKTGNFNGFDSLETVEKLYFQILGSVVFEGFNQLKKAGSIVFTDGKIENITAFQNLEELNGFTVTSCGYLKNINGFGKVKKMNGLSFGYNHINFEKMDCFTSLEEITKDLQMENNQKMHSVYFPKLRKIGGKIHIQNNRRLESIEGLSALEEVGALYITGNDVLASLRPLEKLDWRLLDYIQLRINYACTDCAIPPICSYLQNTTDWDFFDKIELNGEKCGSVEEILANCETSSTNQEYKKIIFLAQSTPDVLTVYDPQGIIENMSIFTIQGQKINVAFDKGENVTQIPTDNLRSGIYLFHYQSKEGNSFTKKWVKM